MSKRGYERVNLFVGGYKVPKGGHLRLADATVRFIRGVETEQGWIGTNNPLDPLWMIVEDGDFWPVMVRLSSEEIVAAALASGVNYTWSGNTMSRTVVTDVTGDDA
jgi:hypothetical protein